MLICIDYDDTYTADPEGWNDFIRIFKSRGHRFICATMRYEDPEKGECQEVKESIGKFMKVIFTNREAKKPFVCGLGNPVNVWIDDQPEWLFVDG